KTLVRVSPLSGEIHAYNVVTDKDRLLGRHRKGVELAGFSADGKLMTVSGGAAGLWDLKNGEQLFEFRLRRYGGYAAISPDGRTVADLIVDRGGISSESVICVWDRNSGKPHRVNDPEIGHLAQVSSVALARDGRTLASADKVAVRVWDVASGQTLQRIKR